VKVGVLKRFFIFFITISKEKKIIVREVFMHTEPKIKVQLGPVLDIAVSLKFDKVWKRDTNFKKDAGV